MKKTILFSLMLVLALGLFSCKKGTLEHDESYANYGVKFEYNGLHYYIINHNSVVLFYHESYQSIRGKLVIPSKVMYNEEKYYVVGIEEEAFSGCESLTSITIPNSVKEIGEQAFQWCYGLTSVTIPNSVTEIGRLAFYCCESLTSVTIPNSVTSIGDWAFFDCTSLTSPVYNAHCFAHLPQSYNGTYIIPAGIKQIAGAAFDGCTGLTSVTIPNSVTEIGSSAFWGCSGLTSITIPNSVTEIGSSAFWGCSGLTSVTIPNSVTSIGGSAFDGCSGLTSVSVPAHTEIGWVAFPSSTKIIRK